MSKKGDIIYKMHNNIRNYEEYLDDYFAQDKFATFRDDDGTPDSDLQAAIDQKWDDFINKQFTSYYEKQLDSLGVTVNEVLAQYRDVSMSFNSLAMENKDGKSYLEQSVDQLENANPHLKGLLDDEMSDLSKYLNEVDSLESSTKFLDHKVLVDKQDKVASLILNSHARSESSGGEAYNAGQFVSFYDTRYDKNMHDYDMHLLSNIEETYRNSMRSGQTTTITDSDPTSSTFGQDITVPSFDAIDIASMNLDSFLRENGLAFDVNDPNKGESAVVNPQSITDYINQQLFIREVEMLGGKIEPFSRTVNVYNYDNFDQATQSYEIIGTKEVPGFYRIVNLHPMDKARLIEKYHGAGTGGGEDEGNWKNTGMNWGEGETSSGYITNLPDMYDSYQGNYRQMFDEGFNFSTDNRIATPSWWNTGADQPELNENVYRSPFSYINPVQNRPFATNLERTNAGYNVWAGPNQDVWVGDSNTPSAESSYGKGHPGMIDLYQDTTYGPDGQAPLKDVGIDTWYFWMLGDPDTAVFPSNTFEFINNAGIEGNASPSNLVYLPSYKLDYEGYSEFAANESLYRVPESLPLVNNSVNDATKEILNVRVEDIINTNFHIASGVYSELNDRDAELSEQFPAYKGLDRYKIYDKIVSGLDWEISGSRLRLNKAEDAPEDWINVQSLVPWAFGPDGESPESGSGTTNRSLGLTAASYTELLIDNIVNDPAFTTEGDKYVESPISFSKLYEGSYIQKYNNAVFNAVSLQEDVARLTIGHDNQSNLTRLERPMTRGEYIGSKLFIAPGKDWDDETNFMKSNVTKINDMWYPGFDINRTTR